MSNAKKIRKRIGDEETEATSIATFCRRHGISRQTYYDWKNRGLTPREIVLRGRRLITREAAEQWRRERERSALPA